MLRQKKWSDDQVQHLVDTVCELRNSDPEPSLLQIIKIAQELIFEEKDRKLILTNKHAKEIIDKVKERYGIKDQRVVKFVDKYKELEERVERLESRLNLQPKAKIAIVGLKMNQYYEVEKEVQDRVELIYLDRDHNNPSFPSSVKNVIVMKDFIKHSYTSKLYSFYSKDKIVEIGGTTDSAKRKILEII